jgi:hypothetical protein
MQDARFLGKCQQALVTFSRQIAWQPGSSQIVTTVHPVNTDIARNIRAVLAVYDLPQKTLVTWLNVGEGQVSKLMSNSQEWRLSHLAAIADRVHIDLATLLGPTSGLVKALPERLPSAPKPRDRHRPSEKWSYNKLAVQPRPRPLPVTVSHDTRVLAVVA